MSGHDHQASFDKAIGDFAQGLRRRQVEEFKTTTLDRLRANIAHLQARQHAQRRLQDLTRIEPFIEAIQQFGEVVSSFYRNHDVTAFIWGPLNFLLQATSINDAAFGEIVKTYEQLGKTLPRLSECQELFRTKPHMAPVLVLLYECVLKLQSIILRYFQQPQWQKVFSESWTTTCKFRLSSIIRDIAKHHSLIESQATPAQIEETQESIQQARHAENQEFDEQNERRFGEIRNWLRPADVEGDQAKFVDDRADYPKTGQWLLENNTFKDWFDPQYATIPPLLWLSGIPGAGKTMLASQIVQEAKELKHRPTVLYFYCKHGNQERDNFVVLGRSLLAQLLHQDSDLLPIFYQKYCRSGEAILSSQTDLEELMILAFENCRSAYIVLDGLDECPREQRKYITKWFRQLVEGLPTRQADRLRCLFISQDDGPARKDFVGLASIKIRAEDTQHDIIEYCRIQAGKLLDNNPSLSYEKVEWIAMTVAGSVQGLFLLARLIWANLSSHTSLARLEKELEPNVFPKGINEAYHRIMARLDEEPLDAAKEDASRLLRWLVCAKRPLKWHEIQVMNSINREERCVALDRQSFIKSPKDLLASLIEKRTDGSLEFVHMSVKSFLLESGYVVPGKEELNLAILCIDYLNLPAFVQVPTPTGVRNGDYGFMEYAVLFWLRHLEVGVMLKTGEETLMEELAESLEIFIHQHWNSPTTRLSLAKRHSDKLQYFKTLPFYGQLEQAAASTKKQMNNFGKSRMEENALDLERMVCDVRKLLEGIITDESGQLDQPTIERRYGTNVFKCTRFSCHFFAVGFSSAPERDKHTSKHDRPFQCQDETCVGYTFGFSSAAEREKHMRENHYGIATQDDEFPTQEDIDRSILREERVIESNQVPDPLSNTDCIGDATTAASEEPASEPDSEVDPQYRPRLKRALQTEFKCQHCSIVYRKRYNLQSHLLSHESERSHVCEVCGLGFVRATDLRRHKNTHTGDRSYVCHGSLRNGDTWGCGRTFARADTLNKHHESRVGRKCIQPLRQQQGQSNSNQALTEDS